MSIPTLRTYHLASSIETGWELLEEFEAQDDVAATEYVEAVLTAPDGVWPGLDWYILNERFENICG
jgi:hypothetical protein